MRVHRLWALGAVLAIGTTACVGSDDSQTTTTLPSTTTTTQPAPTTSSTTSTTIAPAVVIDGGSEADPEAVQAVGDLYTWLANDDADQPPLPDPLASHLASARGQGSLELEAAFTTEPVKGMGWAGVAVVEDQDIVLLVNDLDVTGDRGEGWRVVGAWMQSLDLDPWFGDTIRRVMIIGTDAREWQDPVRFRGDSLHIVSSNTATGGGGILGFPRDSWIEAPYGMDKFTHVNALTWTASDEQVERDLELLQTDPYLSNAARWLGLDQVIEMLRQGPLGGEVTVDVAESLTGLEIEGYVLTGFRNFEILFQQFGSIVIDVPLGMADSASGAYFRAGPQEMWGKLALAFSRNRHIGGGDFTRSFHQGMVILARLERVLEGDFGQLPALISWLTKNIWTDLSLEDLMTLGAGAYLLDPDMVGNAVAPGSVATRGGASVVLLADSAEELYRDMDDGVLDLVDE